MKIGSAPLLGSQFKIVSTRISATLPGAFPIVANNSSRVAIIFNWQGGTDLQIALTPDIDSSIVASLGTEFDWVQLDMRHTASLCQQAFYYRNDSGAVFPLNVTEVIEQPTMCFPGEDEVQPPVIMPERPPVGPGETVPVLVGAK